MIAKIDKIPDNWSGHEIRQLFADYFAEQALGMDSERMAAYRNDCITLNL